MTTDNVLASSNGPMSNAPRKTVICVFCGSKPGKSPGYMEAAKKLAQAFHKNNISLVYGGGTVGLMGEVARNLVALSGPESVLGVIPAPLAKYEQGPDSVTATSNGHKVDPELEAVYGRTIVVKDMHTRKQMMAREVITGGPGSGFIALPGGYGTMEELMEVVTWNQLGIHNRGIVLYNVEGYWDGVMDWVTKSVDQGFVTDSNKNIIVEAKTAEDAVAALQVYQATEGRFKLNWGSE